uniref:SIR2-like domain-containing protein n=1 Tax=Candidatus Kentrum sp. DK TaxID=2126562 RepID=A0A450S0D6_9GAMM|nr:MAG: SIR2-like domain-containing protein [Candidatus Kentron sp. DK]
MRFLENGPRIPDELLTARDKGRVVFFCGAGVSRERAGLPDFLGLAETVIQKLHASADSPVHGLLEEAREIDSRVGVEGLISADIIFGLLEREFLTRDIESEVAKALKPPPDVDLSAHEILLDLATTPEGKVRLVTTNFDRLFNDACQDELQTWKAPRLPDPSRDDEMDGIVYLHGRANDGYSGPEATGFVLSSAQFGRAYLAEGWATEFFKAIMARHVVVFVGYGADDPPVHYLLEGLNRREGQANKIYAFQSGAPEEAAEKWRHKGVEAIAYPEENRRHHRLWDTLAAWAKRAKSPDDWYRSVIDLARAGPANLQPHERGQVAHVVSTPEGAEKFSKSDPPPPAEWLCVFDRGRRYARPWYATPWRAYSSPQRIFVDPFELYGLDSDSVPKKIGPDDHHEKRDVPKNAWGAFAANLRDRESINDENLPSFRGQGSMHAPGLPKRLIALRVWLVNVATQPAAVWWAAHQDGLHPSVQSWIRSELGRPKKDVPAVIRQAWEYLFEAWRERSDGSSDWHELQTAIKRDGWDGHAIRKYAALHRPYLKAGPLLLGGPKPPEEKEAPRLQDLVRLKVKYPKPHFRMKIPDEWLASAMRGLRKNLEHALLLETELAGLYGHDYRLGHISPIVPDERPDIGDYQRIEGLSGSVLSFASLFERLVGLDIDTAHREFAAWPVDDDTIFARFRIWAGGKAGFLPAEIFGEIVIGLSDEAFWDAHHQRDLLLVLKKRWSSLPDGAREKIEKRLLNGPGKWKGVDENKYEERRAWKSLSRLQWLTDNGCNFSFDLASEIDKLRQTAPDWKLEYAKGAVDSTGIRGGEVKTDTGYAPLLKEPLATLLSKALELSGRAEEDRLTKKAPFLGFSTELPLHALSALTHAARQGEYPKWAWETFLDFRARGKDEPRLSVRIARCLCRCPDSVFSEFIHPVLWWVSRKTGNRHWASGFPETFDRLISKLIGILHSQLSAGKSGFVRDGKEPDWVNKGFNSPAGEMAEALFHDPGIDGLKIGDELPKRWLAHVEALLSLAGDSRRYALVTFSRDLNWFYSRDPAWTEKHLLSAMEGEDSDDRNAFWSGFLWGGGRGNQELYLRIKWNLLTVAGEQNPVMEEYRETLAATILSGWGSRNEQTRERLVSNEEMRSALLRASDDFRVHTLWHLDRWSKKQEKDSDGDDSKGGSDMLPEFLRDVWPRQKIARTPAASKKLCRIAFSNPSHFPELAEIILPLLTKIPRKEYSYYSIRDFLGTDDKDSPVDRYPRQTMDILCAVLPDDRALWPYDAEEILRRIDKVDSRGCEPENNR